MVEMLDVPFADKDEAKALGARWDARARRWYIPDGVDGQPLQRWRPRSAPPMGGPTVRAQLVGLVAPCYRCKMVGTAIAGVLVPPSHSLDPEGFISFDFVSAALAALVNGSPVADAHKIGPIGFRTSQQRPEGYLANGCVGCDAILGSFWIGEDLTEHLALGGSYAQLVVGEVELPLSALPDVETAWDDGCGADDDWSAEWVSAREVTKTPDCSFLPAPADGREAPPPGPGRRRWRPWKR